MIKHIVFWSFKESAEGMDKPQIIAKIKRELEALVGVIPDLLKAEVGTGFNKSGFDACLYSEFSSKEALEGYQNHPEHVKVSQFVSGVRTDRAVCDFQA